MSLHRFRRKRVQCSRPCIRFWKRVLCGRKSIGQHGHLRNLLSHCRYRTEAIRILGLPGFPSSLSVFQCGTLRGGLRKRKPRPFTFAFGTATVFDDRKGKVNQLASVHLAVYLRMSLQATDDGSARWFSRQCGEIPFLSSEMSQSFSQKMILVVRSATEFTIVFSVAFSAVNVDAGDQSRTVDFAEQRCIDDRPKVTEKEQSDNQSPRHQTDYRTCQGPFRKGHSVA